MAITFDTIQQLCMEGESNHLDYKRDQYPFIGVSDPEKAELLKDILAMANAFRQQTAYILIGVEQQSDSSGKIIGILSNDFIDDAQLQQFINGKTNRDVNFLSYLVRIDAEHIIQVIEIPPQGNRPYYSKRRLGEVKENEVFFRVGSSTKIATPDDIAKMGAEQQKTSVPTADVFVHIPSNPIGDMCNITGWNVDFDIPPDSLPVNNSIAYSIMGKQSLKQQAQWLKKGFRTVRIDIDLENSSGICIEALQVVTTIIQCSNKCVEECFGFPPKSSYDLCFSAIQNKHIYSETMLRPREYKSAYKSLYLEVNNCGSFTLEITVLGKNIPEPITTTFKFNVVVKRKTIAVESIEELFNKIQNEKDFFNFQQKIICTDDFEY